VARLKAGGLKQRKYDESTKCLEPAPRRGFVVFVVFVEFFEEVAFLEGDVVVVADGPEEESGDEGRRRIQSEGQTDLRGRGRKVDGVPTVREETGRRQFQWLLVRMDLRLDLFELAVDAQDRGAPRNDECGADDSQSNRDSHPARDVEADCDARCHARQPQNRRDHDLHLVVQEGVLRSSGKTDRSALFLNFNNVGRGC